MPYFYSALDQYTTLLCIYLREVCNSAVDFLLNLGNFLFVMDISKNQISIQLGKCWIPLQHFVRIDEWVWYLWTVSIIYLKWAQRRRDTEDRSQADACGVTRGWRCGRLRREGDGVGFCLVDKKRSSRYPSWRAAYGTLPGLPWS